MMSVVWDNSSDVIGLSIKKPNGNVITLLSPTFLKLYSDNGNCHLGSDNNEHDSSGIAFELDAKYFLTTDDERRNDGDQKIIPSIVYQVEFSNNQFTPLSGNGGNSDGPSIRKSSNASQGELTPISELVMKAWLLKNNTKMLLHDLVRIRNNSQETIRCEANITRLEHNALVIVVRNISERFHRFEAEKKAVSETTARIKDAAANRFTRHEVKNGLLSAIGLCDSLKETQYKGKDEQGQYDDHSKRILFELDKTLHEILDTILAEAMARDVIHEVYEPKHERVNVVQLIQCTMNSTATAASMERFPVATQPSPLPDMAIDPQLLKYIHRNAVSNACKYGKRGGVVLTLVKWDEEKGILQMDVINLPGNKHEEILKLGDLAPEIIFSPSKRLPMHIINHGESASHSSGDGAWVMHKCAKTLGGDCDITVSISSLRRIMLCFFFNTSHFFSFFLSSLRRSKQSLPSAVL
jgi:signal transduction histidine kinase